MRIAQRAKRIGPKWPLRCPKRPSTAKLAHASANSALARSRSLTSGRGQESTLQAREQAGLAVATVRLRF
jgi:hypothetical protein